MTHARSKSIVIIMTIFGILFIAAVVFFLFLPTFKDMNNLASDVVDAQAELEAQYTNRKSLLRNSERITEVKETTSELLGQFIEPGQELSFIKTVESIGERNGIETEIRLSPDKSAKLPKGAAHPNDHFDITLNGAAHQVYRSITELESIQSMVAIESTTIRSGTIEEGEPRTISVLLRGKITLTPENL